MTHRLPRVVWLVAGILAPLAIGIAGCQKDAPQQPSSQGAPERQAVPAAPAAAPFDATAGPDMATLPSAEPAEAANQPAPALSAPGAEKTDEGEFPAVGTQPGEQEMPNLDNANPAPELGPPVVDSMADLVRLDPVRPLWVDKVKRRVVMVGMVCARSVPLEMLVCTRQTKEHESVLVVDVRAADVHAALLAIGAKAGHPVQYDPYMAAAGTEIQIGLAWKDPQNQVHQARGQDFVRNMNTGKALDDTWVFAGSGFWVDESTGEKRYMAEGGDFICVSNFSTAMLDLPIESSQSQSSLLFEAFTEHIPPLRTPVTIFLDPVLPGDPPVAENAAAEDASATENVPAANPAEEPANTEAGKADLPAAQASPAAETPPAAEPAESQSPVPAEKPADTPPAPKLPAGEIT